MNRLEFKHQEVLTEGWLNWVEALVLPAGVGWAVGQLLDADKLDKLIHNKEFMKKLEPIVEKAVKNAKKENKNLTEDLPGGIGNRMAQGWKCTSWSEKFALNTGLPFVDGIQVAGSKLNKYACAFVLSNHKLSAIKVGLYDTATEINKWITVPVPKKTDSTKYESTSILGDLVESAFEE